MFALSLSLLSFTATPELLNSVVPGSLVWNGDLEAFKITLHVEVMHVEVMSDQQFGQLLVV